MDQIGGDSSRNARRRAVAVHKKAFAILLTTTVGVVMLYFSLMVFSPGAKGFFNALTFGHWPYIPQGGMKKGHVFARSVVLNSNGKPVYVEYNTAGEEVGEVGEASGIYANVQVMGGKPTAATRRCINRYWISIQPLN